MSEDKSDGKTINLNALPSCIDEPVKEVLTPGAKEIGGFFGDLLSLATGKIHFAAEKRRIQQEHDLQVFKEGLTKKVEEKPNVCLIEPRLQVVGPAMERAAYCLGEDQIREMFQNLIANAADTRYNQQVHPSFSAIIEQMSSLDAENLKLFSQHQQLPIAVYKVKSSVGTSRNCFSNCFLANPNMQGKESFALQAASIGSLERQGLIETTYTEWISDEASYQPFRENELMEETNNFANLLRIVDKDANQTADIAKGLARITPFGKSFIKVCFEA